MYKTFPEILVEFRKKHNLSQDELSKNLSCSRTYIHYLEKGDRNPSIEFLNRLSKLYNIDLNTYYKEFYSDIPFEYRKIYTSFRNAIETNTIKTNHILAELLEEYENDNCFKHGEMRNLYLYTKALYHFHENDFKLSNSICVEALELNDHKIEDLETNSSFFTPIEYCIMVLMSVIDIKNKEGKYGRDNLIKIYVNIKENFFENDFYLSFNLTIIVRTYIVLNNNLSTLYLEEGDLEKSLLHIEEAIDFNRKHYNSSLLHSLYFTKAECLYAKQDYENTIKSVFHVLANCSAVSDELVDTYIKKIEVSFPKTLDNLNLSHIRKVYL